MRPFLPGSAAKLAAAFGEAGSLASIQGKDGYWSEIGTKRLAPGAPLGQAAVLFEKIDDERLAAAVKTFNGP